MIWILYLYVDATLVFLQQTSLNTPSYLLLHSLFNLTWLFREECVLMSHPHQVEYYIISSASVKLCISLILLSLTASSTQASLYLTYLFSLDTEYIFVNTWYRYHSGYYFVYCFKLIIWIFLLIPTCKGLAQVSPSGEGTKVNFLLNISKAVLKWLSLPLYKVITGKTTVSLYIPSLPCQVSVPRPVAAPTTPGDIFNTVHLWGRPTYCISPLGIITPGVCKNLSFHNILMVSIEMFKFYFHRFPLLGMNNV